jgi:translocation and assembly module TamB
MPRSDADTDLRTRRRRHALNWLIALPLAVLLGYLALANAAINSDWVRERLADRTGLSLHWEGGWSWWPGRVVVGELRVSSDDPGLPLNLEVGRTEITVSLLDLLDDRLTIREFAATGVRTLAWGGHRLEGRGSVRVSDLVLEQGRLGMARLALSLEEARVRRGQTVLAGDIRLGADLSVDSFVLRDHPDLDAARFVSGELSLDATADAWDVFDPYLRELDWLDLAGHGELLGRLTLERGELAPGSELTLDSPSLMVEIDERILLAAPEERQASEPTRWTVADSAPERHRLSGAGRITSRVEDGDEGRHAELEVALDEMVMQRAGLTDPFMTSERFVLAARLPGADLADAPRRLASAHLEWQGARLPNVGALSTYLPEGGPFSLESGSASLEGRLDYEDGVFRGGFSLAGNEVGLTLAGRPLSGELALDLELARLDPSRRHLDLSGTRLEVSARGEDDDLPLTTELTLEDAALTASVPLVTLLDTRGPPPLDGRVALRGRVGRLGVLDAFLVQAVDGQGLRLEGGGDLAASLRLRGGLVAAGSRLAVTTDSLRASMLDLEAWGRGSVAATWQQTLQGPRARLVATLEDTRVARLSDARQLMRDGRLTLAAESDEFGLAAPVAAPSLTLAWENAVMPDIAVLQDYLPASAPVTLEAGEAGTGGELTIDGGLARGQIALTGRRITGRVIDERVTGELALDLRLREARLDGSHLDIGGSRLEVQAADAASQTDERLRTRIRINEARLGPLPMPGRRERVDGRLALEGMVANLGVLDDFLPAIHGLSLAGGGRFTADLVLRDDHLRPDSVLRVEADDLVVGFLDFQARGDGTLEARIQGDPEAPGAGLVLSLPRVDLLRLGEEEAHVTGRHFRLTSETPRFGLDRDARALQNFTTRIELPTARVDDLARYNAYLPEDAGLELLGGRADLAMDLHLEGLQARGDITLQAFGTALRLGEQRLSGDLRLDARLRDGDLAGRRFEAGGSRLRLDNVRRTDARERGEAGWWATLDLTEGRLDWTQPLRLDARLDIAMRDSGLLARLFLARAREWDWLGRRLTVGGIEGTALLHLDDDTLQLRDARLTGGSLEMLADLVMQDESLDGSLFARLGILAAGVGLEEGEPRVRLLRPRRWFEANRPPREEDLEEVTVSQWQEALETREE